MQRPRHIAWTIAWCQSAGVGCTILSSQYVPLNCTNVHSLLTVFVNLYNSSMLFRRRFAWPLISPLCRHKAQTPLHGHRLYGHVVQHHQRTSSQQFYNKFATSQCQSPTSRHVKMLGCGKFLSVSGDFVIQQVVELLWARPLVVFVANVRSRCPCSGVQHLT